MNTELVKDAYAIIDGIPDDRISLYMFQQGEIALEPAAITCQTLACAAGWLSLHPDMRKRGLRILTNGIPYLFGAASGFDSLAMLFEMTRKQATFLFSDRSGSRIPGQSEMSDKELWLARCRYLLKHGNFGDAEKNYRI